MARSRFFIHFFAAAARLRQKVIKMPNFARFIENVEKRLRKPSCGLGVRCTKLCKSGASLDLRMTGFSQGASGIADRIHWFNFTAETSISAMHTMYLGLPRV